METFTVDLRSSKNNAEVVSSFNTGLIRPSGGEWQGNNWNAFHDYLSWPSEESYELKIIGWSNCVGILQIFNESLRVLPEEYGALWVEPANLHKKN